MKACNMDVVVFHLPSSPSKKIARFRAAVVTSQHSHQREEEHHWLQQTPRSCIPDPATDRKVECLFLGFLICGHLIVGGDISVQSSHKNHRHHARQEDQDQQRVLDGKPMDLTLSLHFKIGIPAGGPTYVTSLLGGHGVAEHDFIGLIQIKGRRLIGTIRRPVFRGRGTRFNLKAHNAVALIHVWVGMEAKLQRHMVGQKVLATLRKAHQDPIGELVIRACLTISWWLAGCPQSNSPNTRPQSCCEICPSCKATRRACIPTYWSCRETSQWGRPASAPQDFPSQQVWHLPQARKTPSGSSHMAAES